MIRLVKPTIKYKESFLEAQEEFKIEDRQDHTLKELNDNFPAYIKLLKNQEKGMDLPNGYVPASVYWLVDGDKFIGKVSIRHKLTDLLKKQGGHIGYEIRPSERRKGYGAKILALALKKSEQLRIKKVLVTCNEDNIGSKKIIEKNGGVLENKIKADSGKDSGKIKLRYWINIYG